MVSPPWPFHMHLVLLVVLDEQAGRQHVVAVDDQAVVGGVGGPADGAGVAVVGAPGPDVVDERVVRVDDQAVGGLAGDVAADPEEHVLDRGRVARVAGRRALRRRRSAATAELVVPASNSRPLSRTPSTSATCIGVDAVVRDQGRVADAQHHGVRRW